MQRPPRLSLDGNLHPAPGARPRPFDWLLREGRAALSAAGFTPADWRLMTVDKPGRRLRDPRPRQAIAQPVARFGEHHAGNQKPITKNEERVRKKGLPDCAQSRSMGGTENGCPCLNPASARA